MRMLLRLVLVAIFKKTLEIYNKKDLQGKKYKSKSVFKMILY